MTEKRARADGMPPNPEAHWTVMNGFWHWGLATSKSLPSNFNGEPVPPDGARICASCSAAYDKDAAASERPAD